MSFGDRLFAAPIMPSEAPQEKHGLFPAHGCEELKTLSAYWGDGQPWSQTVWFKKTGLSGRRNLTSEPVDHRTLGVSNPYCEPCPLVFTGAEWERS